MVIVFRKEVMSYKRANWCINACYTNYEMCTFGCQAKIHIIGFGGFSSFANIIYLLMPNKQSQIFVFICYTSLLKAFPWVVRVGNVRVSPIWGG
jgi:hypothetical protein